MRLRCWFEGHTQNKLSALELMILNTLCWREYSLQSCPWRKPPKSVLSQFLEPMDRLPHKARGALCVWLKMMKLDCYFRLQGGSNINTIVLIQGSWEGEREKMDAGNRGESDKGSWVKDCGVFSRSVTKTTTSLEECSLEQSLEADKGQEVDVVPTPAPNTHIHIYKSSGAQLCQLISSGPQEQ